MKINEAISHYTETFKKVSDTAHIDAECLVMHCMGLTRAALFTYPEKMLTEKQEKDLEQFIKRRLQSEPIAYITGHKEFWDLDLKVTPDVLIPRPETECLIEWILNNYPEDPSQKVADLGVGSGAIALALAHERASWQIDATDISENILHIARDNAKKHNLKNVRFFQGEWFDALSHKNYDTIVSNPPYIASNDPHLKNLKFEPIQALSGGKDGLEAIRIIIQHAKDYLKKEGLLIFEHGYDQRDAVLTLLSKNGYDHEQNHHDLSGQPRFCTALRI